MPALCALYMEPIEWKGIFIKFYSGSEPANVSVFAGPPSEWMNWKSYAG